uniref:Uncharacterized protein n=1 Tax=Aegilops tauschii subsp. strangulata TaxID=200361 RepID=A0A453LC48_AEGTS
MPFSAMCVRISRDSYPNLHALHNASNDSLTNAAYIKISEGDFGYVLDDVPHLADYLPVSSHPSPPLLLLARPLVGSWRWVLCGAALASDCQWGGREQRNCPARGITHFLVCKPESLQCY